MPHRFTLHIALCLLLALLSLPSCHHPQETPSPKKEQPEENDSFDPRLQWEKEVRTDSIYQTLIQEKRYAEAIRFLEQTERNRDGRFNTPYYLLAKGNVYFACHQYDSARHYYTMAGKSIDTQIAAEAFHRLSLVSAAEGNMEKAYSDYHSYLSILKWEVRLEESRVLQARYQEERLQNELNSTRLEKRNREMWLLALSSLLLLIAGGLYIQYLHRKRRKQAETMHRETERLNHENLLLKQSEELRTLREKEALLRESLFRRMSVTRKIPSLETDTSSLPAPQKIVLTENDWEEIRHTVDGSYNHFTQRLEAAYPTLTLKELHFCCLLKINVSLQDLSDIYCISKTGISKRKLRLKKEKFHLNDSTESLDEFLQRF